MDRTYRAGLGVRVCRQETLKPRRFRQGETIELKKTEKLSRDEKAPQKPTAKGPAGAQGDRSTGAPEAGPGAGPTGQTGKAGRKKASCEIDRRVAAANAKFGLKLFSALAGQDTAENIFISPYSVGVALAVAFNGASGESRQAIAETLELQGMNLEEVNRGKAALATALVKLDPKLQLTIANSLWARKGMPFKPDFIVRNTEYYGAHVENLDFYDPAVPARINEWVARKTRGKIQKIVARVNPQTVIFLVNAVYFKGTWTHGFNKNNTAPGTFTLPDGRQQQHPMMSQTGRFRHLAGENFQAVSLPYGSGKVSMYVFLPNPDSGLAEFYGSLNADNWERWLPQFREKKGRIVMPRLKLEYECTLNDTLKNLGMAVVFDPHRADFRDLIDVSENAYLSNVKHKTLVEVHEEGTEAAGVTSVEVGLTCVTGEFYLVADRPFFFAIRDDETGVLLFTGSIVAPRV